MKRGSHDAFVRVRGAREHNLQNVDVEMPRDSLVAFTGVSGSGKSSLAFGTIYAEAQRRYFESVAPYARRLIHQMDVPKVEEITGLPPAVALQQRRGAPSSRSTVGTVTTLSNHLRMLFSRAGTYPPGATEVMDSDWFSPNTAVGACPACHGLGKAHTVTEETLVPDPSLSIRERAIAAWPGAWQGQNLRDILVTLGHDIDRPWKKLPRRDRDWILFTDEQPTVEINPDDNPVDADYFYNGTFSSAERHVMHTLANSKSPATRQRALQFVHTVDCPDCHGTRLRPEALAVTFGGHTIAELSGMPLTELAGILLRTAEIDDPDAAYLSAQSGETTEVAVRIADDLHARLQVLVELGLGYLSMDRETPTLSPGEMQRLRLATQLRSGLFGVVYVLDEPSAGLHPADAEPLMKVLEQLKAAGNSLFVVEHDMDVVRRADWVVEIGPGAGEGGGRVLYSGPIDGLRDVGDSPTRRYLFGPGMQAPRDGEPREPSGWLCLHHITRHNLKDVDAEFPLGVLCAVTGVSGSGKSTLVTQVLADVVAGWVGHPSNGSDGDSDGDLDFEVEDASHGVDARGLEAFDRLVRVDQKPIGRTPRSNLATYTGMFDAVRKLFADTDAARRRGYTPGRFSFNVPEGRCETCKGEGFVAVELLFLPGTYAACPTCHGARYNPETLEVRYRDRTIAEVLDMTVDEASEFFADVPSAARSLETLARGRARLPAARAAGHRAVRRRGAAHQAGNGAPARPARPHPVRARRADDGLAPRRHRAPAPTAASAGRRRQHRRRGRARDERRGERRLGDRSGPRRGRRGRAHRGGRQTRRRRARAGQQDGAVPGRATQRLEGATVNRAFGRDRLPAVSVAIALTRP